MSESRSQTPEIKKVPGIDHPTAIAIATATPQRPGDNDGESFDEVPAENRRLGTLSAVMLIANRIIGTVSARPLMFFPILQCVPGYLRHSSFHC